MSTNRTLLTEQGLSSLMTTLNAWASPVPKWEAELRRELLSLPVLEVKRWPMQLARSHGHEPHHCHHNALGYVQAHAGTEHVLGWIAEWPQLQSHSVVRQNGELLCVTPPAKSRTTINSSGVTTFLFIEDRQLRLIPGGLLRGKRRLSRPYIRRIDPDVETMRRLQRAALGGADPHAINAEMMRELMAAGKRACERDPALAARFKQQGLI